MRKLIALLVVLLIIAGAILFAATNLNRYLQENRDWLAQQATTALGRQVSFADIGVSFSRGLGAKITDVAVADDPAFGKDDFLRVASANVIVEILPALSGRYEVRRVELDAPRVNVIKTKSGFNFDSIGQAKAEGAKVPAAPGAPEQSGSSAALPFLVSLLHIRDGHLRFVDKTTSPAREMVVDKLDFSAADVSLDKPISVDIAAAVLGFDQQNVRVGGTIGPLGSPAAAASAPVDMKIDLGPLVVDRLKKLALVGESIPPELSSADPVKLGVKLSGKLDALQTVVSLDATDAGIVYGDQLDKPKGVRFKVDADVKQSADTIDVGKLDFYLADAHLVGKGTVGMGASLPVDFELSGTDVPLGGWGRLLAAATAVDMGGALDLRIVAKGPAGGGKVPQLNGTIGLKEVRAKQPGGDVEIEGLTTIVALKGDRVEIPPTDFKLNGSPVRIAATVKSLQDLSMEFSVKSPALDVAALGAGGEGISGAEVVKDVEIHGNFVSAASGPRLDATIRSAAGSVRDIAYEKLMGETSLRGQKLTLKRLSVNAFDGNVVGAGSYDMAQPDSPAFSFRGKVNSLDVAALGSQLGAGSAFQMSGRLNADLDVTGAGAEWEAISQALAGSGALQVDDGVLKGVNIAETVFTSVTGIPGLSSLISPKIRQKYPELFGADDTVFEALGGKMTLKDGMALLDQIALAARDYRIDGKGTIALSGVLLDLGASFIASQQLTEDLRNSVKELKYLTDASGSFRLPLRLTGAMPSIKPQPDSQYVMEKLSGALVQKGLDRGLDALFGKKKQAEAAAGGKGKAAGGEKGKAPAEPAAAEDLTNELIKQGIEGLFGGGKKK
jgi:hypothetical protein